MAIVLLGILAVMGVIVLIGLYIVIKQTIYDHKEEKAERRARVEGDIIKAKK